MKKWFEEDMSLHDLKAMIRGLHKKKSVNHVLLCVLCALLVAVIISLVVVKLRCCCDEDFSDFDYDDDFEDDEEDYED